MNGSSTYSRELRERELERLPFFQLGNEILDIFQPIMGPHCYTIYSHLARSAFKNPALKHSVRDLAKATKIGASTASRALEIMAHLGLVKLVRRGGSQESECELLNSGEAAKRLGAEYVKRSLSWTLKPDAALRLSTEVEAIRQKQQGHRVRNPSSRVSQRNASVSPAIRQRVTRETQTGSYPIREEGRTEEVPSPTPSRGDESHFGEGQKDKDSPDEDEPDPLLKWARAAFTGPMNDLGDHLFDSSKPPVRHLANGASEWERFGFESLAVVAAAWRGKVLLLSLSAHNPGEAARGLYKYRKTWGTSLRKWFECEVHIEMRGNRVDGEGEVEHAD